MSSKPFSVRATEAQHTRWKSCAAARSLSLNKWIVQALDDQAALEEAERSETAALRAERERLKKITFPQGPNVCKHVSAGQWCYRCNRKRW